MSSLLDHKLSFVKLTKSIVDCCKPFSCKHDNEIENFFHTEFEFFEEQLFAKSYAFITEEENPRLVCAFSVSNSLLPRESLPPKNRNRIDRGVTNSKRKFQHPAVLVGQLAVFDEFARQGMGDFLMTFIKDWLRRPSMKIGFRFILVDATNDPHVLDFYLRNGFLFLFDSVDEEMESLDFEIRPEAKRTRLMYFDLIKLAATKI